MGHIAFVDAARATQVYDCAPGGQYWSLSAVIIGYVLLQAIKKFNLNVSLEEPSLA